MSKIGWKQNFRVPCGIDVKLTTKTTGKVVSGFRAYAKDKKFRLAVDIIEQLVLIHAINGIDIESDGYSNGIETVLESLGDYE